MGSSRNSNLSQPENCAPLDSPRSVPAAAGSPLNRFYLVNLGNNQDWGIMVNDGTPEQPYFKVLFKAGRAYAERLLTQLNRPPTAAPAGRNLPLLQ